MGIMLAATTLSDVITAETVKGVFDEIIALLPIILPVAVTFIGIRKGISFLFSMIKSA